MNEWKRTPRYTFTRSIIDCAISRSTRCIYVTAASTADTKPAPQEVGWPYSTVMRCLLRMSVRFYRYLCRYIVTDHLIILLCHYSCCVMLTCLLNYHYRYHLIFLPKLKVDDLSNSVVEQLFY